MNFPPEIRGKHTALIKVQESDAADIINLRNRPEINRFLSSQKEIALDEQIAWIRQNTTKNDGIYFKIVNNNNELKGTVSLYDVDNYKAEFGRYICTNSLNAIEAEYLILKYAFEVVKLGRISCHVVEENTKVCAMHLRFGFTTLGTEFSKTLGRNFVVQEMDRNSFLKTDFTTILSLINKF
ncbi:MAG: GNAT family N-acetyltransferase [Bacteroidetes bacterium]|nr:GNAT family N-acetyltransferase [Bacteroidota bacterium]